MLQQLLDGNDFYATIVEMGEEITFLTEPNIIRYASIAPHRITNTTDGAYWYRGAMTFDSVEEQNKLIGEYFTRQTNAGPKYILTSVMPENTTPKMATVYAVECNEVVDVISHYQDTGEVDKYGEPIIEPVYLAQDIDVYMTMTLERIQTETPGGFIETKTVIWLPAKTTISSSNIVLKQSFVFDKKLQKNVYSKIKYRVESIDTSMMDIVNEQPVGVVKCLLTEDKR